MRAVPPGMLAFAQGSNGGLIVTASVLANVHRDLLITLGLCVPKTLSVLIGGGNHLTSAHNDRAAMLCP